MILLDKSLAVQVCMWPLGCRLDMPALVDVVYIYTDKYKYACLYYLHGAPMSAKNRGTSSIVVSMLFIHNSHAFYHFVFDQVRITLAA